MQQLKKRTEGFTIIEVMIVLVIAAVILLIVFLAVPALQRNSRNTQRKSDAARLLAAAGEWRANNKNALLPACLIGCTGVSATNRDAIYSLAGKVDSFPQSSFTTHDTAAPLVGDLAQSSSAVGQAIRSNISSALIIGQAKCDDVTLGTGSGIVIVYGVEASGNNVVVQCVNS